MGIRGPKTSQAGQIHVTYMPFGAKEGTVLDITEQEAHTHGHGKANVW